MKVHRLYPGYGQDTARGDDYDYAVSFCFVAYAASSFFVRILLFMIIRIIYRATT
jgi:hypothetical protein